MLLCFHPLHGRNRHRFTLECYSSGKQDVPQAAEPINLFFLQIWVFFPLTPHSLSAAPLSPSPCPHSPFAPGLDSAGEQQSLQEPGWGKTHFPANSSHKSAVLEFSLPFLSGLIWVSPSQSDHNLFAKIR